MMKNLAVIPARGGSKRIPQKNIKAFAGKPLIAYSIEAAIESKCFDKVIVSTDSKEIAELAKQYGAEVPFIRPENLSGDFIGTTAVTKHAIQAMEGLGYTFDFTCCIYATAPFLQAEFLQQGLQQLKLQPEKAFAFSATSFPFPIQRALSVENGDVGIMFPEHINKRSQDLPETYHDAGQFYWGRSEDYLRGGKAMFSKHAVPIILPRYLVQDIDTPEDWLRAELMYKAYVQTPNCD